MVWRSCWRRCSIHEPIRKVSINRPGRSISSYTAQLIAPARRRTRRSSCTACKNAFALCGSMMYSCDTSTGPRSLGSSISTPSSGWPLRSRFKSGSFSSFQRNTVALASTIPSVATTSEVGVPNCDAICPQMALPVVIEPKNTVR